MRATILPDELYALTLASCDFEELSFVIEKRLPRDGFRSRLRQLVPALAGKIWNLDVDPGPRQRRHLESARLLVIKCAVNIDCVRHHLTADLFDRAKELLSLMMEEIDRLQNEKGAPVARGRPLMN